MAWVLSTWSRAGLAFALDSPFPPCSSTQPALTLLCKFFPRMNDQSGRSQPSLLLWLNGEVTVLIPSSLFMLGDNTLVTSYYFITTCKAQEFTHGTTSEALCP